MDTIASRLAAAMKAKSVKIPALVKVTGMTYQGIKKILDGKTASIQAENLFAMAAHLDVDPHWLATGEVNMLGADTIDTTARWVDDPLTIQAPATSVSKNDADVVHIPYYDTGGAMGHGIVLRDQPGVIREMSVSKEWLQSNVKGYTSADNLCLVTGFGDSMRPLFMSGDPVIVDKGVTEFRGDGLYFFRVDGEGFIKRLQSIPGRGLRVISENPSYESWNIDKATTDFQVLGKVIKAWCGCDF